MIGNRDQSLEIRISDISNIPQEVLKDENGDDKYDIQFSSKENCHILWVHPDGYKEFDRSLMPYMIYVRDVYNRRTKTDHLNLYSETQLSVDDYGIDTGDKRYKNITWTELRQGNLDPANLLLRSEITF